LAGALAMVGTTLTAYVYVWETVERGIEEPPDTAPGKGMRRARIGVVVGAVFTAGVFWFMLVASAATLGRTHASVTSAQEAAGALRPLAGTAASDLFAIGLVISALVALPVLMATTAYVVGAEFNWRRGLSEGVGRARAFYAVMAISVALAVAVGLADISVLGMLVAASIIGGIGTPIGLVILVLLARDPTVMGEQVVSRRLSVAGWVVAALVAVFGLLFVCGAALGKLRPARSVVVLRSSGRACLWSCCSGQRSHSKLTNARQVVLHSQGRYKLAVLNLEYVDLIDAFEPAAGARHAEPFRPVSACAPEVRDHLVAFGDQLHDFHLEMREGGLKWTNPGLGDRCELAGGKLLDDLEVPLTHRLLNQAAYQQLVVFN
jgi:hypothetical protein